MPEEREFQLPGLTLAAREWGDQNGRPLIFLHGWLDNAGSFDLLAPLLKNCRSLAVDSAGHGLSTNRSADSTYNIWQEVGDVVHIADQMGWGQFTLVGHSRGANVATLIAGTFPERIDKLVLIEGGVATIGNTEDAPENLAQAFRDRVKLAQTPGRIFANRGEAIAGRKDGWSMLSEEAAEILAVRSLYEVQEGFQWRFDQRLKGKSEFLLTRDHLRAFVLRVKTPVLLFLAQDSPIRSMPFFEDTISFFCHLEKFVVPGGHHLHLEGAETLIAERIEAFFAP